MLTLLLKYYRSSITRYFKTRALAKAITAFLFFIVLGAVGGGVYFFVKNGMIALLDNIVLIQHPQVGRVMPLYLYELFLLVIGYLVFVSGCITGLFTIYSGTADKWIMASPRFLVLPRIRLLRIFASSLWTLLVIALPGLLALKAVFGFSIGGFLLGLFSLVLLIAVVASTVMVVLCGASAVLYGLSRFIKKPLITFAVFTWSIIFVIGILSFFGWKTVRSASDLALFFKASEVTAQSVSVDTVTEKFQWYPTHLTAITLYTLEEEVGASAVKASGVLGALLLLGIFMVLLLSRLYLPVWERLQEGRFYAKTSGYRARHQAKSTHFPRFLKSPIGAIFEKEAIITVRSARNILWFCFLLILWLMQTGLNILLSKQITAYEIGGGEIPPIVHALQFATSAFFVSAFVLRFAFPSFSSEGRTAWIIGSAPIAVGKLFWAKLLFYLFTFMCIGVVVSGINSSALRLPPEMAGIFFVTLGVGIIFLTAFGLALGAFFPNFGTEDPQLLSTSLPGLAFTLGALLYGGIGSVVLLSVFKFNTFLPLVLFEVISISVVVFFLSFVPRSLRRIEFGGRG